MLATPEQVAKALASRRVEAAPVNDDCSGAMVVNPASLPYSDTQDLAGATHDRPDYNCTGSPGPDVWYTFTPAVSGRYLVGGDAAGQFYEVVTEYTGACGALAYQSCSGNWSAFLSAYQLDAGTTYTFAVSSGNWSTPGLATFTLSGPYTPSPNDDCANAIAVASLPFTDTQDLRGDLGDGVPGLGSWNNNIWYTFVPPQDGTYLFQLAADGPASLMLAQGDCGGATEIRENTCSSHGERARIESDLKAGTSYLVQVGWSVYGTIPTAATLTISQVTPAVPAAPVLAAVSDGGNGGNNIAFSDATGNLWRGQYTGSGPSGYELMEYTSAGAATGARWPLWSWAGQDVDTEYDANHDVVYIPDYNASCVHAVDLATGADSLICDSGVGGGWPTSPASVAYDPATDTLYLAPWYRSLLWRINRQGDLLGQTDLGFTILGLAWTRHGHLAVVPYDSDGLLYVLDPQSSFQLLATVLLPGAYAQCDGVGRGIDAEPAGPCWLRGYDWLDYRLDIGESCVLTCGATVPSSTCLAAVTSFTGTSTAVDCWNAPTYVWDFGDGTTAEGQNVVHVYNTAGSHTWKLTVSANYETCTTSGTVLVRALPVVSPASLPGGTVGYPYSQTITASAGTMGAPGMNIVVTTGFTFTYTGTLPPGLSLAPLSTPGTTSVTLSGTPSSAGSFTFTVTATDANGCAGSRQYTVTVAAYDMSFQDDYGRSTVCVNSVTGAYAFTRLTPLPKKIYRGTATITTNTSLVLSLSKVGVFSLTYNKSLHTAAAALVVPKTSLVYSLADRNTLDDQVTCGSPPPPPTVPGQE